MAHHIVATHQTSCCLWCRPVRSESVMELTCGEGAIGSSKSFCTHRRSARCRRDSLPGGRNRSPLGRIVPEAHRPTAESSPRCYFVGRAGQPDVVRRRSAPLPEWRRSRSRESRLRSIERRLRPVDATGPRRRDLLARHLNGQVPWRGVRSRPSSRVSLGADGDLLIGDGFAGYQ